VHLILLSHAHNNEERSAEVAADFLSGTGLGPAVTDLILATRHKDQPASPDASLICGSGHSKTMAEARLLAIFGLLSRTGCYIICHIKP